jgi:hypothetical protein
MFLIVDTTPPTISNIIIQNIKHESGFINVSANVTDNYQLSLVWIEIFNPDGNSVGIFGMEYDPIQGKYYLNNSYNNSGAYTFTIRATDTSENQASFSDLFNIDAPEEPILTTDEYNWKPIIALIFAIILLLIGIIIVYKRPMKFTGDLSKDRWYTFFPIVLPFIIAELITGIISLTTGLLTVRPILGLGMIVDLIILIAGIASCAVIYKKGEPYDSYETGEYITQSQDTPSESTPDNSESAYQTIPHPVKLQPPFESETPPPPPPEIPPPLPPPESSE